MENVTVLGDLGWVGVFKFIRAEGQWRAQSRRPAARLGLLLHKAIHIPFVDDERAGVHESGERRE